MILDVIQVSKELCSADFVVKRGLYEIGSFSLKGNIVSMEADITLNILGKQSKMSFNRKMQCRQMFRPYCVVESGSEAGEIFMGAKKLSFFKRYDFKQLNYFDSVFQMYTVGLGKEGYKFPIYKGSEQIAQVEKDCVVYNDLHNYKAFIKEEDYLNAVIYLCAYNYVTGPYEPGEKTYSGKETTVYITTNKLIKEKYNPEFTKYIEE